MIEILAARSIRKHLMLTCAWLASCASASLAPPGVEPVADIRGPLYSSNGLLLATVVRREQGNVSWDCLRLDPTTGSIEQVLSLGWIPWQPGGGGSLLFPKGDASLPFPILALAGNRIWCTWSDAPRIESIDLLGHGTVSSGLGGEPWMPPRLVSIAATDGWIWTSHGFRSDWYGSRVLPSPTRDCWLVSSAGHVWAGQPGGLSVARIDPGSSRTEVVPVTEPFRIREALMTSTGSLASSNGDVWLLLEADAGRGLFWTTRRHFALGRIRSGSTAMEVFRELGEQDLGWMPQEDGPIDLLAEANNLAVHRRIKGHRWIEEYCATCGAMRQRIDLGGDRPYGLTLRGHQLWFSAVHLGLYRFDLLGSCPGPCARPNSSPLSRNESRISCVSPGELAVPRRSDPHPRIISRAAGVGPLGCDQAPVPAEDRVGRDDGGNLRQDPASKAPALRVSA